MKKIIIIGLVSLCAVGAYAQGTLQFYNQFSDLSFHIYAPNTANPNVMQEGNNAADGAISGTSAPYIVYGGIPIGGASGAAGTPINYSYGNNFYAQVFASPAGNGSGAAPAFSSLSPVTQYMTTLATTSGEGAGSLVGLDFSSGDAGIPGTGYDGSGLHGASHILNNANVAIAAWYNAGGTITSLAQAESTQGIPYGYSAVTVLSGLGEPASVETSAAGHTAQPTTPTEMYGIQSFSLVANNVPEPSTIALGVMGACAFLARRRKK
jgi:hypothetical protein